MQVLNIHKRTITQSKETLAGLLATLATKNDRLFPYEKWPAMRFKQGLVVGAKGGHGPIRYTIKRIEPGALIEFEFTRPKDFHGIHKFELIEVKKHSSELKKGFIYHSTDPKTNTAFDTFPSSAAYPHQYA